ncbi:MAG: MFS transporter [Nitrospirales bacterium]|nr:MFS transporter [Nitrospirales bacterium]
MNFARSTFHPNVRVLQAHTFCFHAIFILPVLVPYFREVIGVGFQEFLLGEAIFSATVLLMEVPTGWLSDVWTRRKTFIASTVVSLIGWIFLWQATSFSMVVIAQIFLGIAISLLSGTNSALLYDSLLEDSTEHHYLRLEGFRHGVSLYSVGGASLLGGVLYAWHVELPIIATIAFNVLALLLTLFAVEPSRHRDQPHRNPFVDMAQTMRYALYGHSEIAGIIFISAGLFAGTKVLLWIQQPYYLLLALPVEWFGVLAACGFLLGGLASHYGHLSKGYHDTGLLFLLLALLVSVCVISGLWPGWHGVPLLLTGSLIWGFGWPRMQEAINARVSSGRRATILSTASLMKHVVSIPLFVVIGRVEDQFGVDWGLLTLAGGLLVAGCIAFVPLLNEKRTLKVP